MAVYKESGKDTWRVIYRYKNWDGEMKQSQKRGFKTKIEATAWEHEQHQKMIAAMDMTFESFLEHYKEDTRNRIKLHTWMTKETIIRTKFLPYFKGKKMNEIAPKDIIKWHNLMIDYRDEKGKPYSHTYLKSMHNQMSAIFNHAVTYYDLKSNPAAKVGNMGKKESVNEMLFWTKEEYLTFVEEVMTKPIYFYAFEILYWCGLRIGELLALTPKDFNFEKSTVTVDKSYQRLNGNDVITEPKTPKSNRIILMPDFLCEEIKEFVNSIYGIKEKDRIFQFTKSGIAKVMKSTCEVVGVKRIRIHDLRHSHVSLLIDMGFSAVAIVDRVGHETIDITFRYAHLFPTKQTEIATKLNVERGL